MSDDTEKKLHELFEIKCKKCNSIKVKPLLQSDTEGYPSTGFYGTSQFSLKCEECGNTKSWNTSYEEDFNYNELKEIKENDISNR